MGTYRVYYDSGTTNSRAYLLDEKFNVVSLKKKNIGSKDSAIAGSNRVLIEGLYELYRAVLEEAGLEDGDIAEIYASGMITTPYGLHEVPHLIVPLSVKEFADKVYPFFEETMFKRTIYLVPGLKTLNEDFSFAGNMRGEEIEILGTLDELSEMGIRNAALMMPGSHTHIARIKNDTVEDILSNIAGELFYALQKETILSPIIDREPMPLEEHMVKMAVENLERFGFNRALYIVHAMRIMDKYTEAERYSYCEGVVNGGLRQSLEYYLENIWKDCDTLVLVSNSFMHELFSMIFDGSSCVKNLVWLPTDRDKCYAVQGLRKIIESKN